MLWIILRILRCHRCTLTLQKTASMPTERTVWREDQLLPCWSRWRTFLFNLNIDPDHWKGPWHHNEDNGSHPSISCRRDSCDMESWRKIHFHDPMGPIGTGVHATEDVISDLVLCCRDLSGRISTLRKIWQVYFSCVALCCCCWRGPAEQSLILSYVWNSRISLRDVYLTRQLNSSLGAEVDIIVLDNSVGNSFVDILRREGIFYFPVFRDLTNKEYRDLPENVIYRIGRDCNRWRVSWLYVLWLGSFGECSNFRWRMYSPIYIYSLLIMFLLHTDIDIAVRVRPASLRKCPRCWTFTRPEKQPLCGRCSVVVGWVEVLGCSPLLEL